MLFLTSWNTNKVYADSGNVTSGESIAKNNNPQEGNPAVKDNAQIVDNGSTNGSTEASDISDSKSSKVIKSDATNRDNVRDKNDNSGTEVPELTAQANNKKVVSNRAELTANDAQTKSAQQAANSNPLVVQQTKKLTGNAKYKLAYSKAQTDTKTDSNYSVTDNYPEGLMNYLPRNFNNEQEYAFEWLRNENNNNIILTTDRTGKGVVYVYQDRTKVGTLAKESRYPFSLPDTLGHHFSESIGTVYNDDFAGIVQSNGYRLNIIYSSHAKDVDNAYYSTISFFVPHKITQTVTYKDSNDKVIDSLTHTQDGLTGQSYTTGLPSGPKYVQQHQYLANITHNGNGLISEFHDDYSCTKDYHDGISVTFMENDSRPTGTGTMDYVIYDGDVAVQWGYLAYGQSTNYTKYIDKYIDGYTIRHTIVNPYVPQTAKIVYQYKKLGYVVNKDPKGTTTTEYENDQYDPTKVKSINVPSIPGYTTLVNGKTVSDKTIMPADPGQDTIITYSANAGTQTIIYKEDGHEVGQQVIKGKTDEKVKVTPDVPDGYVVKGEIPTEVTIQPDDNPITVTVEHGKSHIDPEHPVNSGDHIPGTKDKTYPTGLTHNDLNKTVTREVTITDPTGKKSTTTQTVTFTRGATVDEVTNKVTYDDWSENGKHTFDKVDVPTVPGYTASGEVPKVEVTPDTQSTTVNITYSANAGTQTIIYKEDGHEVGQQVIKGKTDEKVKVTPDVPDGYVVKGEIPTEVTIQPDDNPITVTVEHGKSHIDPEHPVNSGDHIPGTKDKTYPTGLTHNDLNKTVTREVTITDPTGKKSTTTQTVTFTRGATVDEVTNKVTYDDWSENGKHTFDKVDVPTVPGYTASGEVPKVEVTPDTQSTTVNITYSANAGTQTIIYKEDGHEVGQQVIKGKTDEKVKVTPDVPDGYVVKGEIPTEVTIQPDDNPITVTVEHGKSHIDPEHPVNSGDHIPGTKDKTYPTGLTHNDLNKTVTREVTITDPTGKKSTTTQTVTFTRGATVDEVTNKVTYDDWSENGKHTFDKVDVPTVPGYTASGEVPKVEVTPDTQSTTVNITYSANAGTQTIIYKEDGHEVGQQVIKGKTDEKVKVTPDVPDGYVVKGEIPTEVTIQPDDNPITVTVEHGKSHIDPEHPVNSGDHIPGTKDKTYPTGLTHNDLNKTVTREVTITDPTGKKSTTTQTVTFTRGATVDEVTNKVTYDDWSENGKHTFDKVDVPTVPGYTASGEVPKVEVTPDTQSTTVNITYSANAGTQTIIYKEDGHEVGQQVIKGKTDEKVKVTPDVPDGYVVKGEIPTEVTIQPDDNPITVTVEHGKSHIDPEHPVNSGDQGDTPTPEPTPEPEPTPNPTPDNQPDSEISSDEHFENVKAKNKLDKTNPKKVDAYKKQRKIIKTKIAKQGHTEIAEPIEDKVTRENNVKVVSDPVENKAAEPKLPQTGEADNSIIGLLGMLLASFAAIFGFDSLHSYDKKHKN